MQLRKQKGHRVSGLGRSGVLVVILSAASLPLAAQNVMQLQNGVRQQVAAPAASKPAAQAAPKPAAQAAVKPAGPTAAKPAVPTTSKPSGQPAAVAANDGGDAEAKLIALRATGPRRDPFSSLIGKDKVPGGVPDHLPPGKAGLVVATLRVDGIVQGPNGMIAIVSNAQDRVYFLRDGDRLYDGQVDKIRMDGVSFHQSGKDPFGKPVEREIDKRLYPTPGEQQ